MAPQEPHLGYIVLHQVGGGMLVLVPGDGIKFIPPEDPEWGKRVGELNAVFQTAFNLAVAGAKTPQYREQLTHMAADLVKPHIKQINQICEAATPAHA